MADGGPRDRFYPCFSSEVDGMWHNVRRLHLTGDSKFQGKILSLHWRGTHHPGREMSLGLVGQVQVVEGHSSLSFVQEEGGRVGGRIGGGGAAHGVRVQLTWVGDKVVTDSDDIAAVCR